MRAAKCRPLGVCRGACPLPYWGIFSDTKYCGSENSLISYGIFFVNTRAACLRSVCIFSASRFVPTVCACRHSVRSNPTFLIIFSLRWVAGRSFPFSKALLYGAVGCKVSPINTLAAQREEDLSGNGVAA